MIFGWGSLAWYNTTVGHGAQAGFPDASCLKDLLRTYQLTNTRAHDSTPSYSGPRGSSSVDFLFMRKVQCDRAAMHTRCLKDFPLTQARERPDHRPLLGHFPADWKVWYQHRTPGTTAKSMGKLTRNLNSVYQSHRTRWRSFVDQATTMIQNDHSDPPGLVKKILGQCQAIRERTQQAVGVWQHEARSFVARKWRQLFWARSQAGNLRGIVRAWAHWTKFHQLDKRLSGLRKRKKRNRIRQVTNDAARAAARHDSRGLYEAVRALAPKQARRSIRFRDATESLHSPEQELELLIDHFTAIMGVGKSEAPPLCAPTLLTADEIFSN